jgi:hypothetical protein
MRRKRPAEAPAPQVVPPDRLRNPLRIEDFPGGQQQADWERDRWLAANPHHTLTIDEYRDWLVANGGLPRLNWQPPA